MRKLALLCALIAGACLVAAPASAIIAFGVHGGLDLNEQDLDTLADGALSDNSTVSLTREKVDAPLMVGAHVLVDILPVLDVEVGLEGSFAQYHVEFDHTLQGAVTPAETFSEDIYLGRATLYASGKFNMVNLPLVKAYAGAGAGYHVITPLVSRELLEEKIVKEGLSEDALAPKDINDLGSTMGFHVLAGVRAKAPVLPFALTLEGRYYLTGENDYGDETNNFLTIAVGFEFGI